MPSSTVQALPVSLLVFCPELAAVQGGDPRTAQLELPLLQDGPTTSKQAAWTVAAAPNCTACIFLEATVRWATLSAKTSLK